MENFFSVDISVWILWRGATIQEVRQAAQPYPNEMPIDTVLSFPRITSDFAGVICQLIDPALFIQESVRIELVEM
ncbi:MAG: hypothetical protein HKM01_01030 [Gallionella sp.]|nr:hypothetical protein [Gallionella sp.]